MICYRVLKNQKLIIPWPIVCPKGGGGSFKESLYEIKACRGVPTPLLIFLWEWRSWLDFMVSFPEKTNLVIEFLAVLSLPPPINNLFPEAGLVASFENP